jgi:hypothetical protein
MGACTSGGDETAVEDFVENPRAEVGRKDARLSGTTRCGAAADVVAAGADCTGSGGAIAGGASTRAVVVAGVGCCMVRGLTTQNSIAAASAPAPIGSAHRIHGAVPRDAAAIGSVRAKAARSA